MTYRRKYQLCAFVLFAYGTFATFVVACYCTWGGYRMSSDQTFVWWCEALGFVTVMGGGYFFLLMRGSVRRALEHSKPFSFLQIMKGGTFAVLAMLAALETFFILSAIMLGWESYRACPHGGSFLGAVLLAFIDIQTYGLIVMIATIPFDFFCGTIGVLLLAWAGKRLGRPPT